MQPACGCICMCLANWRRCKILKTNLHALLLFTSQYVAINSVNIKYKNKVLDKNSERKGMYN